MKKLIMKIKMWITNNPVIQEIKKDIEIINQYINKNQEKN